jgi:hypothetical protein
VLRQFFDCIDILISLVVGKAVRKVVLVVVAKDDVLLWEFILHRALPGVVVAECVVATTGDA